MSFPGHFKDSLIEGSLESVSLSFLVDELVIRRGGCAANIAFGLGVLGLNPILIAAVGADWKEYEDRKSTRLNSSHSQQSRMPSSA